MSETTPNEGVFVHPIPLGPWDNLIYLIGDRATRTCAVVDPAWHAETILAEAERLELTITHVLATHSHVDHVNRVDSIVERLDVPVHMLRAEIDFAGFACENLVPSRPGDVLTVGEHAEITFVHTPGHTPGSTCYRVRDGLVTGDTLFVDGCGRCDFVGGDPEVMWATLRGLLAELPGGTTMYPGHDYGPTPTSTLEAQTRTNPFLLQPTLADFVRHRMEGKAPGAVLPPAPDDWTPEGA